MLKGKSTPKTVLQAELLRLIQDYERANGARVMSVVLDRNDDPKDGVSDGLRSLELLVELD